MKREIKFRAWANEKMGVSFNPLDSQFLSEGGTFPEETVFMQFTGLHDKNGREIYEGDILNVLDEHYDTGGIGVVKWGGVYPAFEIEGDGFEDLEYNTLQHACSVVQCEIIGNIHQNPELINP